MEVTPPVARYEQVARHLRQRILGGEFPPGSRLPSGPDTGREYGVSQHMAQRAFEILAREGLVQMTSGSGTTVLPRRRWRVELSAPLPPAEDAAAAAAARTGSALEAAAGEHPAIGGAQAERAGGRLRVTVTAESADLLGALAAVAPVARQAFGPLPIAVLSAREA